MNNCKAEITRDRNYGIDLLRVYSMFLVVILHCLGQGGLLSHTANNSLQYKLLWFMKIFAYCSVNIFALISGYVSFTDKKKKFKISNYIKMWIQVVFYGIFVVMIFRMVFPNTYSVKNYLLAIFPVSNNLYWYFTAYTGLFFLTPFLNAGVRECNTKTLKKVFIVIFVIFSLFGTLASKFNLINGYSVIWLILLYILGAIIKKCQFENEIKNSHAIVCILILVLITYLYKIYGLNFSFFNITINKDTFVSYTSPTIVLSAILHLIIFSKLKLNNKISKYASTIGTSAFSIYLLNTQSLFYEKILRDLFVEILNKPIVFIFMIIVLFSIAFCVYSILIDKLRILLFRFLHVDDFANKISNFLEKVTDKILISENK